MIKLFFTAVLIIGGGCSASYHVKKAIKKNPLAFHADTLTVSDTIIIEVPKVDTVFTYRFDTVEYIKNRVKIKYHYDTLTKNVFIEADCPDDAVIYKTKTITLPPIIVKPSLWGAIKSGSVIAISLISLMIIAYLLIKIGKKVV